MTLRTGVAAIGLLLCLAPDALADRDKTFILATGRRDPRMYAIDLQKALRPENDKTPNAIVSRSKTALDRLDGKLLGDPANVVVSEDRRTAFVVNHHGAINNDEFVQHGGRGGIALMNVKKMIDRKNDDTAAALERHVDSGHFGAVGLVLLPDLFVIGNAESHLTEDGGNRITFVDRRTGSLRGEVELALASAECETARHFKVPFASPNGPPSPVALLSPDPTWGCFPDTNGVVVGHSSSGKAYLFTANGGTDDVSVIDLLRALGGDRRAEVLRIPTQIGPWGMAVSPNGRWIVAANRESQKVAFEGNTISIIDADAIERAIALKDPSQAEVARVLVGTSDPNVQTRPFIPSFTPDGNEIVVPNFRANNVSIVSLDLARAVKRGAGAEVARIPIVRPNEPDGQPIRASRPKGSAVTSDGRYAVISAGPRVTLNPFKPSGTVSVIDLKKRAVVATVTGVGNDPYGLALVETEDD